MEAAATPLRQQRVHVLMGRVLVENLVVDDPAAAAFVRTRLEAGDTLIALGRRAQLDQFEKLASGAG